MIGLEICAAVGMSVSLHAEPSKPVLAGPPSHYEDEGDGREPVQWIMVMPARAVTSDADLYGGASEPVRICRPADLDAMAREGDGESPWALGAQMLRDLPPRGFTSIEDAFRATHWTGRIWLPPMSE